MDKRLEELKQAYLSDSAKVRTLENNMTEFNKKMAECEMSTFRELFPLSTNHQIAPGVNGQGFNEEKIHISKYGLWTSDFKSL
jgi:hypothetical protein